MVTNRYTDAETSSNRGILYRSPIIGVGYRFVVRHNIICIYYYWPKRCCDRGHSPHIHSKHPNNSVYSNNIIDI